MKFKNIGMRPNESFIHYIKRIWPGVLRRIIPSYRERRRLELMVGPPGFWKQFQKYQLHVLTARGLKPEHRLLDIGCGPISGGLKLIPYLNANKYVGIDIKTNCIKEAHIQLAKANLSVKNPFLAVSKSFGKEELGDRKFDYIWAGQVLYHFDDNTMNTLFKEISSRMILGSIFLGDILGSPYTPPSGIQWQKYKFYGHTPDALKTVGKRYGLQMINLGQICNFNYPKEVGGLSRNELLEFKKI